MRTQRYIFNYKVKIKKQLFRFSRAAKPRICKRRRFRRGGTLQKRTKRVRKRSIGPLPEGAAREDGRPCVRGMRPAPSGDGGGSMPAPPEQELHAGTGAPHGDATGPSGDGGGSMPAPSGTGTPCRPSPLPTARTGPMPAPPEKRLRTEIQPAPSGNGSGSMPAPPEQELPAGPRRSQRPAPARTGPTPALLPDDPAPPVRGTTPDDRHPNTLPAPTTHRPEHIPPARDAPRSETNPPPGMRRGPIFARYSPNVLPSDK